VRIEAPQTERQQTLPRGSNAVHLLKPPYVLISRVSCYIMPDWPKKLWKRKNDASMRSPSPVTPPTLSGGGPKADEGDGVTVRPLLFQRRKAHMLTRSWRNLEAGGRGTALSEKL
jgi:hypothetical protein